MCGSATTTGLANISLEYSHTFQKVYAKFGKFSTPGLNSYLVCWNIRFEKWQMKSKIKSNLDIL